MAMAVTVDAGSGSNLASLSLGSGKSKDKDSAKTAVDGEKKSGYKSDDSVNLVNIQCTKEDVDCLDITGEDLDAVQELYMQNSTLTINWKRVGSKEEEAQNLL